MKVNLVNYQDKVHELDVEVIPRIGDRVLHPADDQYAEVLQVNWATDDKTNWVSVNIWLAEPKRKGLTQ